jgi:hypothetical protein
MIVESLSKEFHQVAGPFREDSAPENPDILVCERRDQRPQPVPIDFTVCVRESDDLPVHLPGAAISGGARAPPLLFEDLHPVLVGDKALGRSIGRGIVNTDQLGFFSRVIHGQKRFHTTDDRSRRISDGNDDRNQREVGIGVVCAAWNCHRPSIVGTIRSPEAHSSTLSLEPASQARRRS